MIKHPLTPNDSVGRVSFEFTDTEDGKPFIAIVSHDSRGLVHTNYVSLNVSSELNRHELTRFIAQQLKEHCGG